MKKQTTTSQIGLFDPETALSSFFQPHSGRINYGAVSRRLHALSKTSPCMARDLAIAASPIFKEPHWLKRYAA